jgi:crossover junction endodeoxyribonuclease RuvC
MRRILGIDPGLASTGFGVIETTDTGYRHLYHGVITTGPTEPTGDRLSKIYREIEEVIRRFSPGEAAVESLFFSKNATSAIPVAQARGVVLLALSHAGVTGMEYAPQAIKRALVGQGRAEKHQVQELVRVVLGLPEIPSPDHAADALAVAVCHVHHSVMKPSGL